MAIDQWVLFIAAGVLLNLTPGPDVLFIVAHAARCGARAGVVAALGIAAGCCVHVVATALGVSALLAASGTALALLKWLGALYLVCVGARMLQAALGVRAKGVVVTAPDTAGAVAQAVEVAGQTALPEPKPLAPPNAPSSDAAPHLPLRAVFRRGFLTNVLNPKVALFFLAFVPQFIAPGSAHAPLWFLGLGLLFTVNSTVVNTGWALAAAWTARRAGALARTLRWLDGVAGALFVALGVKLALSDMPGAPGVP